MKRIDFRTPVQRERDAMHKSICDMYLKLNVEYPDIQPTRMFAEIANVHRVTEACVRNVLVKNNLYQVRRQAKR